ncbi:MAG: DUF3419 family protein [Lautropia sp.]|nr:DUF3419 family protein [Lautropia sp.]
MSREKFFKKEIKGPLYNILISKGFNKNLLKLILNDKRYDINIEVGDLGRYMLKTLDYAFCNHLAKESDWLTFMFTGKYNEKNSLPHFLKEDVVEQIKKCKTKVSIVNGDIVEYCGKMPHEKFNKFSLSDITSCLSKDDFMSILKNISTRGRLNGRLCFRNFITNYSVDDANEDNLEIDNEMMSFLNKKDRAFSYRFEIATIADRK